MTRERVEGMALGLLIAWGAACTSWLPMTHEAGSEFQRMPDWQVAQIAKQTGLTPLQVKDPTIHEAHANQVPCAEMLRICYPAVPTYAKFLGSIPLACTVIYQQPWNEKVAITYHCWATDPLTMHHERKHAEGGMHRYW